MQATNNPSSLLSVEDVAKRLGISIHTVYPLVNSGEIKATRIGKQWRVSESDLAAYLEANSNQREVTK